MPGRVCLEMRCACDERPCFRCDAGASTALVAPAGLLPPLELSSVDARVLTGLHFANSAEQMVEVELSRVWAHAWALTLFTALFLLFPQKAWQVRRALYEAALSQDMHGRHSYNTFCCTSCCTTSTLRRLLFPVFYLCPVGGLDLRHSGTAHPGCYCQDAPGAAGRSQPGHHLASAPG